MRERYASMVDKEPLNAVAKRVEVMRSPWNRRHPLIGPTKGLLGILQWGRLVGSGTGGIDSDKVMRRSSRRGWNDGGRERR